VWFLSQGLRTAPNRVNTPGYGTLLRDRMSDGTPGPVMVVIPPGTYWMGTDSEDPSALSARPRHRVHVPGPLAVARTETTVAEFRKFMAAGKHTIAPGCWRHLPTEKWVLDEHALWQAPGYEQAESYPVTCVNWFDAVAFADWVSDETGENYRLPSEAEFEYFARAGGGGDDIPPVKDRETLCSVVNGADQSTGLAYAYACNDGYAHASPAGHFPANGFGLFDTTGNLWEFTADCWNDDYRGNWRTLFQSAPDDGGTWTRVYCGLRVIRGGSYLSSPHNLAIYRREPGSGLARLNRTGIRLVRDL